MSARAVIICGAGGHGGVIADALLASGRRIAGFIDADAAKRGTKLLGIPVLGGEEQLAGFPSAEFELANGIGSVRDTQVRAALFGRLRALGYTFAGVRHPAAVISAHAVLAEGVQLMAGCVVQIGARLEMNVLVNTSAIVDHDCHIGADSHIAPGAALSGEVVVGAGSHIGTGACVVQGVRIGRGCVIGAGSVVVHDIPDRSVAVGAPARAKALA